METLEAHTQEKNELRQHVFGMTNPIREDVGAIEMEMVRKLNSIALGKFGIKGRK